MISVSIPWLPQACVSAGGNPAFYPPLILRKSAENALSVISSIVYPKSLKISTEFPSLYFINVLQNPYMYGPGHPVLILRRAELFRLCAVGEETALGFGFI
jgi:hypothetical protein